MISYNPGYQSVLKDLKPSTRQRFVSLEFDYPGVDVEAEIIAHEGGADPELVRAARARSARRPATCASTASTRASARGCSSTPRSSSVGGIEPRRACDVAIARAVSDDVEVQRAVAEIVDVLLP